MDNALLDGWLRDFDLTVIDEASVSAARTRAREVAASQSLSAEDAGRLATIASELAHNQLFHARAGRIAVRAIARGVISASRLSRPMAVTASKIRRQRSRERHEPLAAWVRVSPRCEGLRTRSTSTFASGKGRASGRAFLQEMRHADGKWASSVVRF